MQVILRHDVEKLGLRGDVVNVADGYARNFLIPRRLAERATAAKVAELQKREAQRARQEARTVDEAREIADRLAAAELRFDVAAGPTGRLFGSVTPTAIADQIWETLKIRVDRRKVNLLEPIKRIGRHEVPIEIFQDVVVQVRTAVVPEGGELPSDEELAAMEAEERAAEAPEPEAEPQAVAQLEPEEASGPAEPPAEDLQVPGDAFDRAAETAVEAEGEDLPESPRE